MYSKPSKVGIVLLLVFSVPWYYICANFINTASNFYNLIGFAGIVSYAFIGYRKVVKKYIEGVNDYKLMLKLDKDFNDEFKKLK